MKKLLRHATLWLFAFATLQANAQQQITTSSSSRNECPGVPGACGYVPNSTNAHTSPNPTPQNGNGTLGNIFSMTKCGLDYAYASQRLGKRLPQPGVNQPAPFVISGIPTCAVIEKAYLWAEGSGNGAAQTATVAGPFGTGNFPMTIVGTGPDKCWGYSGSYTYRADVTAIVGGNGTYNISGILTNPPTSGNDMDGATLVVIWSNPTQPWAGTISISDGAYVVNGGVANYVMTYPAVCGATNTASAFMCVGDIQFNPTSWTLNGTAAPLTWNWWDFVRVNTTVAAGQTSSAFNVNTGGDCFNLCVAGLYYRTTTCTTCPAPSALVLNTTFTNPTCTACNGSATVNVVSGGSPPYTYSWSTSPVQTTQTATNLCAGTYTVTVTANGGCLTATTAVTLTSSGGGLTITPTQTNVNCYGGCTGSGTVTVTGGTPPYTYAWTPNVSTGSTASALCAGSYTVNVTSANGCTGTTTITITQPPQLTSTATTVNVSCFGGCNGTATATPAGGSPGYTYSWNTTPVQTTATATGLCAGSYTCTITDTKGCTVTQTVNITQPTQVTASATTVNVSCFGGCNGSATATGAGGTPGYTYSWNTSPVQATPTATGLCAGSYTCTVTDTRGCTATVTVTITQPPQLTSTSSQTNVACNGNCTGTATINGSGGTPTYTYSWNTTPVQNTQTATALCAGTYTGTITDSRGCTTTQTVTITQPPALTISSTQTNVSCNGGCNGTASVTVTGGTAPYTYSWNTTPVQTTPNATGLCAGSYTCTVTDAGNCTITRTVTITQPPALVLSVTVVNATCGNANGSVDLTVTGGTPNYTYSWSNSATTQDIGSLLPGVYTVTVTDANLCTATISATVNNLGSPTITVSSFTNVTCFGLCNGTASTTTTGGASPYSYSWSTSPVQTGQNATALCAGTYTVTVTDANSCQASASVTITQPTQLTATTSSTPVSCNGGCNGTATITGSGGTPTYTYSWNSTPVQTTQTATALCAGSYTGTITDSHGCTATQTVTVTQPTALTISGTQTNVSCNGGCNGSATVTAGGGTAPYSYSWNTTPVQTTPTATGLCAGSYTCTVTDANNCTITQTFTITQPAALVLNATTVSTTCGNANGSIDLTVTGGVAPYTFAWSNSAVTEDLTNILAGTYSVTVTDANLCTATLSVTVSNFGSPSITVTSFTDVTCYNACDGTAITTTTGGTGPYTYSWNTTPVQTGANATALCAGSYTVTVTDANNCQATASVTISQPTQLTASATTTDALCFGSCDGTATAAATGGTAPYSYSWNTTPVQTTATAINLCAGSYTCTVTDANNCTTTVTVTIAEPTQLTLAVAGLAATCNGACDGQLIVIPSGGTPAYTYSWSSGCTNPSCNNICAGTYTIDVTDSHGCLATNTVQVTEPTAITATSSSTDAHCNQADGDATVTPSGGTPGYTYAWNTTPVQTTATATGLTPGPWICVITDANLCSLTVTVTVNNIPGVTAIQSGQTDVTCNAACDGTASVTASSGTPPYTYSWNTTPVQTTPNASALCAGNYVCTITDAAGCIATVSVTITQPSPLTLAVATPPWPSICNGQTTSLQATPGGGTAPYVVTWNPGNLPGNNPTVQPTATTTYTATVTDQNGCTANAIETITVNPVPVANLSGDLLSGCAPVCVNFTDLSTIGAPDNIASWNWDFGDGNTSTLQSPSHCYTVPGVYTVILTVTSNNGCTHTVTMSSYINVFAVPTAGFIAGPQPTTILNPTITFTDQSSGATQWNWSFGDFNNSTSTLQSPVFTYADTGCFQVYQVVSTPDGCMDTANQFVCITPDFSFFIPNAFTPNDDGRNDFFMPKGEGINPETFEMWIFDRWGNMIFYTDDLYKGWNGHANGGDNVAQIDSYVYKIKFNDIQGDKHNYIGRVSLIK